MLDVNLDAVFRLCRTAGRQFREQDGGDIVDVTSVQDTVAYLVESSYVTGVRIPVDGGVRLVG